jgi:hypothetical protein
MAHFSGKREIGEADPVDVLNENADQFCFEPGSQLSGSFQGSQTLRGCI